jgi:hypothetical protein
LDYAGFRRLSPKGRFIWRQIELFSHDPEVDK